MPSFVIEARNSRRPETKEFFRVDAAQTPALYQQVLVDSNRCGKTCSDLVFVACPVSSSQHVGFQRSALDSVKKPKGQKVNSRGVWQSQWGRVLQH